MASNQRVFIGKKEVKRILKVVQVDPKSGLGLRARTTKKDAAAIFAGRVSSLEVPVSTRKEVEIYTFSSSASNDFKGSRAFFKAPEIKGDKV